jgi:hypothetical protein
MTAAAGQPRADQQRARERAAAAERQRRSRARRRAGFRTLRLDIPLRKVQRAIRARNNLPDHVPITQRQMERLLIRAIVTWCDSWLAHLRYRPK